MDISPLHDFFNSDAPRASGYFLPTFETVGRRLTTHLFLLQVGNEARAILKKGDADVNPLPFTAANISAIGDAYKAVERILRDEAPSREDLASIRALPAHMRAIGTYYGKKIAASREALIATRAEIVDAVNDLELLIKNRDIEKLLDLIPPTTRLGIDLNYTPAPASIGDRFNRLRAGRALNKILTENSTKREPPLKWFGRTKTLHALEKKVDGIHEDIRRKEDILGGISAFSDILDAKLGQKAASLPIANTPNVSQLRL